MRSSGGPVGQRKLCLCGPGGGGTTCGLCFARALVGDGYDQCGGLFAPLVSIGARFRVDRQGLLGGLRNETSAVSGNLTSTTQAFYQDSFVVGSALVGGQCLPSIESWTGGGSARLIWTRTGTFPYSADVSFTGPEWDCWGLAGPPAFPMPGGSPQFRLVEPYSPSAGVGGCTVEGYCGYAYPRPFMAKAYVGGVMQQMAQRCLDQFPPGFGGPGTLSEIAPFDFFGLPATVGWFQEPCAGFRATGPGGGWQQHSEQWQNQQGATIGVVNYILERQTNAAPNLTALQRLTRQLRVTVTPLTPCPGDGGNAALIAAHNGKGYREGCCG